MKPEKALLVFTDLDGTLLDHHDYSFTAAEPMLAELAARHIPLILNTSKTYAEVLELRQRLAAVYNYKPQPFIVENGAGIYLPPDTDFNCGAASFADNGFQRIDLATPRETVLEIIHELRAEHGFCFTGFADMMVADIEQTTGLDALSARQAMNRDYTEPLLWQDSSEARGHFSQTLKEKGLQLLEGGRFWHVMSAANKGKAMQVLSKCYQSPAITIALGDGGNDVAMLEVADWPVVIKAATKISLKIENANTLYTTEPGPSGWNSAISELLATLHSTT
jgi:mannosyl-3-phosphoglycerate phosphatase